MTDSENDLKEERRAEQKALTKQAIKEGIKEWLNDEFAAFGWWSFKCVGSAVFALIVYFWLTTHGWKAPQITP